MARPVVMAIACMVLDLVVQGRAQNTAPAPPAVTWERTRDADEAKRSHKSADEKAAPKSGAETPPPQENQRWERAKQHSAPPQSARPRDQGAPSQATGDKTKQK